MSEASIRITEDKDLDTVLQEVVGGARLPIFMRDGGLGEVGRQDPCPLPGRDGCTARKRLVVRTCSDAAEARGFKANWIGPAMARVTIIEGVNIRAKPQRAKTASSAVATAAEAVGVHAFSIAGIGLSNAK